ncbi:DUF4377 domain-containing protein [Fluviicola sp.]|uniref:DUF4377 domain-containing protein n=1 Tax=Fluviicola sp. TaxID=1917219 RepID=UPI0031CED86B
MFKVLFITLSLAATAFHSEAKNSDGTVYSDAGEISKMRIQAHRVACQPGGAANCFSVQKGATIGMDSWEVLQQPIEGFDYEEGYTYDVIVKVDAQPGKTGAERFKYTLVEIISKVKEA